MAPNSFINNTWLSQVDNIFFNWGTIFSNPKLYSDWSEIKVQHKRLKQFFNIFLCVEIFTISIILVVNSLWRNNM